MAYFVESSQSLFNDPSFISGHFFAIADSEIYSLNSIQCHLRDTPTPTFIIPDHRSLERLPTAIPLILVSHKYPSFCSTIFTISFLLIQWHLRFHIEISHITQLQQYNIFVPDRRYKLVTIYSANAIHQYHSVITPIFILNVTERLTFAVNTCV